MNSARNAARLTAVALVIAAIAVVVQILSGAEYPSVPLAFFILLIPAGLLVFTRWRFGPVVALISSVFLLFGLIGSGAYVRLVNPDSTGDTIGLWLMTISLIVATTTAVIAARGYYGRKSA